MARTKILIQWWRLTTKNLGAVSQTLLTGFGYVTSATQARFSLQGYYSGQLFKTAELSPLRPKPENYRSG